MNQIVPEALAIGGCPLEIRHQSGEALRAETEGLYRRLGVEAEVPAFIQDMAEAYRWADLAICRAGAMTLSELAAAGLPAILVPYPHAIDDHQTANARYFAEAGAALLLPQSELTSEKLAELLKNLLQQPDAIAKMSRHARELAKPEAARELADVCLGEAA